MDLYSLFFHKPTVAQDIVRKFLLDKIEGSEAVGIVYDGLHRETCGWQKLIDGEPDVLLRRLASGQSKNKVVFGYLQRRLPRLGSLAELVAVSRILMTRIVLHEQFGLDPFADALRKTRREVDCYPNHGFSN